jgi:TatD DNase family protein
MLVDSHCHLDYAQPEERAAILARAREAGVLSLLTIGTKVHTFPAVRAIAEADPDIWCSVGIHPHEAAAEDDAAVAALVTLAAHDKVVGIGETGLDFHYDHSPRPRQHAVFRAHCAAARETGLPLIVHTRNADAETAAVLAAERPPKGVIHCFSTGQQLAEKAIEIGFYISLSGILTFKNAGELRVIAQALPLDRLLLETDAPYLAPVPQRGKPNEPAFLRHTAECLARLKDISLAELGRATSENFFRLFNKARPPRAISCA